MEKELHIVISHAKDIRGNEKHISEVESGQKGYFCIECGCELVAKIGEKKRTPHFAHVANNVLRVGKCSFSDETHRHKIAKEILQRIKQIKVPDLYKFPPTGVDGKPYLLKKSYTVEAHSVRNELYFYENEKCEIWWGNEEEFDNYNKEKNLLIKPDVAFFDSNNKPVLLIEIVLTNKISDEKLSRIKHLGLDTIQIIIPKTSEIEIEQSFYKTEFTKWVFNNEQERPYIPISDRDYETVLSIDEFERRILEAGESFKCRSAQLKNFIRRIGKTLETEEYRNFEEAIRSELHRVEAATKLETNAYGKFQESYEKQMEQEFGTKFDEISKLEREYAEGYDKYKGKYASKYEEHRRKFEPRREAIWAGYRKEMDRIEQLQIGYKSGDESEISDIKQRHKDLQSEGDRIENEISGITIRRQQYQRKYENFETEISRIREEEERVVNYHSGIRAGIERRRGELSKKSEGLNERRRNSSEELQDRVGKHEPANSHRTQNSFDCCELFTFITEETRTLERLLAAKKFLERRTL